jgi:hypothetical protein
MIENFKEFEIENQLVILGGVLHVHDDECYEPD